MMHRSFTFDFSQVKLDISRIEDILGYKDDEKGGSIADLIKEFVKKAGAACSIRAEYAVFDNITFDHDQKSVEISGLDFRINRIIYNQLKKSDSVAIFLCTAGQEISDMSRRAMKEGDLLGGYIIDIAGSEIVDAATDLLQDELEKEMLSAGKRITNRFSPGYCGWDVSEQHKLFRLMPDNWCGIRLNASALMEPIKSVSGFIGAGGNVRFHPYTCNFCDMDNCIYRKKKGESK